MCRNTKIFNLFKISVEFFIDQNYSLFVLNIFYSLLSLSLLLALAINYLYINYSNSISIGSLLDKSDSKSNELKWLVIDDL